MATLKALAGSFYLQGDAVPTDARVRSYRVHEAVLWPYEVDVVFETRDTSFRVEDCLQNRTLLTVDDGNQKIRHFDGLPDRVGFVAAEPPALIFTMRLRPAIAALEHRKGSRIFQEKTPIDVIKEMLSDAGVDDDVEWRLRETYAPREFLCQYRETELNFLHRLCEEEGVFYFFHHSPDGHKLIFADNASAFAEQEGLEAVALSPTRSTAGTQPLLDFQRTQTLRPTVATLRDYDFEKPGEPPTASVPAPGNMAIEHFIYPGGFTQDAEASRRAQALMRGLRRDVDVCRGESRATGLVPGIPMTVEGAHEEALNGDYVITELVSEGESEQGSSGELNVKNTFSAIPKDAPFALPRRSRKVRIRGIQTAMVTGPADEPQSIHVDEYGRIKVRFFWDRSGKQDDTSSCWLRVSQLPLGGSMVLPRVGWEMAVAFLDGDPDRPVVLGRTYNAEEAPPYGLPGAAADGSLKSMSSPGGAGSNEIKTGDTAGSQGMSMSAQKDLNVACGNDKNETVGVDEEHSVGANYKLTVGASETTSVGANQEVNVGNAFQVKVAGSQSVDVGGNDDTHSKCDFTENVGATRGYEVGGNQITISCGVRTNVKAAFKRKVGAIQAHVSLASIHDNMLSTYDETVGAIIAQLVNGPAVEDITGNKEMTSLAAELHVVAGMSTSAGSGVKQLIGGVHLRKCAADYTVTAPTIVLAGGSGKFKGGGSQLNLDGGPITLKGGAVSVDAALIVKMGSSLKIG